MANRWRWSRTSPTTLGEELNFVIEARSIERFATNLRRFGTNEASVCPTVHWPLTTPRVLTMERIHGYKIDDLERLDTTGWDLAATLKRGVRAWLEAALATRLLPRRRPRRQPDGRHRRHIVFLDFGICGTLDDTTRDIMRYGLPALLVHRDFQAVAEAIYDMGAVLSPPISTSPPATSPRSSTPILDRPLSEISYGEVLIDIIRIGTRYEVRLPRELVLVAKQLLYFERYAKLMAPDWTILDDPELIALPLRLHRPHRRRVRRLSGEAVVDRVRARHGVTPTQVRRASIDRMVWAPDAWTRPLRLRAGEVDRCPVARSRTATLHLAADRRRRPGVRGARPVYRRPGRGPSRSSPARPCRRRRGPRPSPAHARRAVARSPARDDR